VSTRFSVLGDLCLELLLIPKKYAVKNIKEMLQSEGV
jgi:hypothetical protein